MYGGSYVDVHDNEVVNVALSERGANLFATPSQSNVTESNLNIDKAVVKMADDEDGKSTIAHFGLDKNMMAHWGDAYSRLAAAGLIKAREVSKTNFTWLMCGEGTAPLEPIRWYGSTRVLADMVRRYLNSRWEIAMVCFKDKKGNELPKSFKNTSAPNANSAKIIDQIFQR